MPNQDAYIIEPVQQGIQFYFHRTIGLLTAAYFPHLCITVGSTGWSKPGAAFRIKEAWQGAVVTIEAQLNHPNTNLVPLSAAVTEEFKQAFLRNLGTNFGPSASLSTAGCPGHVEQNIIVGCHVIR